MSQPNIKYDEASDTLTVCFEPGSKATGIELTEHILLRINQQKRSCISIVFFEYSVLAQTTQMGTRSFSLNQLLQISTDLREMVFDILLSHPVSEYLQLSAYTISTVETIPIILLQPRFIGMSQR